MLFTFGPSEAEVTRAVQVVVTERSERRRLSDEGATAARAASGIGGEARVAGGIGGEVLSTINAVNSAQEWLGRYRWTHFATLTFSFSTTPAASMRQFRRWVQRIQIGSTPIPYVCAAEGEALGITPTHLHALIAVPLPMSCALLQRAWGKIGWSSVRRYDPTRGAARYVMKGITRDNAEWDISAVLPEEY